MRTLRVACIAAIAASAIGAGAPAVAQEPVELTVMHWGNQGDEWWQQRFTDFQATHPNVTFKQDIVPYGQYIDKLGAYQLTGDGPDVLLTEPGNILAYPDINLPLQDYVDQSLYPGIDALCYPDYDCTNGDVKAIPWSLQAHPLYYNKAILTEAGLDPESPPVTWADMIAACDAIKATGKACIAAGPKDFGGLTEFAALLNQTASPEECIGLAPGTTKATDPWFANAFALWKDMVDRGWFQDGVADANLAPEAQDLFTSGGAGFYTGLLGDAYDWKVLGAVLGDDLGAFIGPRIEQDSPLPGVGPGPLADSIDSSVGSGFAVARWTDAQPEAIAFAQFMTSPEQSSAVTDAGSYPAVKGFDSTPIGNASLDQLAAAVAQTKGNCTAYLPATIFGPLIAQTQLILAGSATPEQAAQAIEDALVDVRP